VVPEALHPAASAGLPATSAGRVLSGRVLVFKNPGLHPGDARVLTARSDLPAAFLRQHYNQLVFSSLGDRPEPDKITNSDLDGDQFLVVQLEGLLPARDEPPMEPIGTAAGTAADWQPGGLQPSSPEVLRCYSSLTGSSLLGRIANAHLAQSDQQAAGCFSSECLQLAEAHAVEVDAIKTQQHAQLEPGLLPKQYPDFMQKPDRPSYRSETVLGALYRRCAGAFQGGQELADEEAAAAGATQPPEPGGSWLAALAGVPGWRALLPLVQPLLLQYQQEVQQLALQAGVDSEAELAAGACRRPCRSFRSACCFFLSAWMLSDCCPLRELVVQGSACELVGLLFPLLVQAAAGP
jgi:hypothetical protein